MELGESDDATPPGVEEDLPLSAAEHRNSESQLLQLPTELLHHILSNLPSVDLARVSSTCRALAEHASNDLLWANLLNANLPCKIYDPGPFASFRGLYTAYYPYWFIPRNKVWFSDSEHTGNLILARYDNRRGVVEAYRVVAERRSHQFQTWEWNPDVIVLSFNPKVSLWLDDPVLFLKNTPSAEGPPCQPRYLNGEIRMPMAYDYQTVSNSLSLCSNRLPSHREMHPDRQWPPPNIPSDNWVYRDADTHWSEWDEPPKHQDEISESAFRIRRWAHFRMGMPVFTAGSSETMTTFATLDPSLYTPSKDKPYQGIWVGDYSAHGCEFLLFIQRGHSDGITTTSTTSPVEGTNQPGDNNNNSGNETVPQGSLEAVKLTGDPNVPRGEISFISEDIGPGGFVRIADDALFPNSRIVRSKGHVAGLGFRDGEYNIPLPMMNRNKSNL